MALWDSAFIFDFESSGTYQSMVHQNISTQGGISGSEKISFGFVIYSLQHFASSPRNPKLQVWRSVIRGTKTLVD